MSENSHDKMRDHNMEVDNGGVDDFTAKSFRLRIGSESESMNEAGTLGASSDVPPSGAGCPPTSISPSHQRRLWQLNYQEAAIYLQEGENNDKFQTHPSAQSSLPGYLITHNFWMYLLDLCAAILLMSLALLEDPAVPLLRSPIWVHASLELLAFAIIVMELAFRMKWLGPKVFFSHIRSIIKFVLLFVMIIEAWVVMVRQTSHFRVTRALRPMFLLDCYYCRSVRRFVRHIIQSLPPIFEMLSLLLFFMLLFSVLGFYLFSHLKDEFFNTIEQSYVSLFVLLTTANYPDVMMPAYSHSRWSAIFFICYICVELYLFMNLFLAVVYDAFSKQEKNKLKKLLLHKRQACQFAFKLLVSKENPNMLSLRHFSGLMKHFVPKKSRRDKYLTFKAMNKTQTGYLSLAEFHSVYEMAHLTWKCKRTSHEWYAGFTFPLNKFFLALNTLVTHKWFEATIYIVIFANFLWILADTITVSVDTGFAFKDDAYRNLWCSILFVSIYSVEACLKIVGLSPRGYFKSGWNIFDFLVTVAAFIGLMMKLVNHTLYFVILFRPLRMLRLFKLRRSFRDIFGTILIVMSRMVSLAGAMVLLYYSFAIIGMEIFSKYDLRNCCVNSSVEDFYKYSETADIGGHYYLNNFGDLISSGITLFELTVVNNWHIIMEGFALVSSEWSRIYFMVFYLIIMIVMNVVVAFVLEAFLFRIQYRQKMHVENMEDHSVCREQVSLIPDELQMCVNTEMPLTNYFILHQPNFQESENIGECYASVFRGERFRSKNDFSLIMYADEVQDWISAEEEELTRRTREMLTSSTNQLNESLDSELLDDDLLNENHFGDTPTPLEVFHEERNFSHETPIILNER